MEKIYKTSKFCKIPKNKYHDDQTNALPNGFISIACNPVGFCTV